MKNEQQLRTKTQVKFDLVDRNIGGVQSFMVKAVDISGNESFRAAVVEFASQ